MIDWNKDELEELYTILGHRFKDQELLNEALTHTSISKGLSRQKKDRKDLERLEFLGDRVLGLIISEKLFTRFDKEEAGTLSQRFHAQVQRETLAEVAIELNLSKFIQVSAELRQNSDALKPSILEDCVEALIAALYLDGGMKAAKSFVKKNWWSRIEAKGASQKDPKSALQEWAAKFNKPLPVYEVVKRTGPDHSPEFTIEVRVEGCKPMHAKSTSKRSAEKLAAENMLKVLKNVD